MPRITPQTREARRRDFIEAGRRCITQNGYRNVTVDDICSAAGRSKGSFYSHFREKQDLLVALLEVDAGSLEESISEFSASGGSDRIRRFLRSNLDVDDDHGRAQLRAELWAEVANDPGLSERMGDAVRRRRSMLASVIDIAIAEGELANIPSNAFAAVLLALADGLALHASVDPGGFRSDNVRRTIAVLLDSTRTDRVRG